MNLYAYARNNPLGRTDPTGHCDADGETHGLLWCTAHLFGFVVTKKEAEAELAQQQGVKRKVLKVLGQHRTAANAVSNAIILGTVISGAADGGASEAAVPEEIGGKAALQTAIDAEAEAAAGEAGKAGEASEEAGAKANDSLKSIEKTQQRVRNGIRNGKKRIIDDIQKSKDRLSHVLDRIT